MPEPSTAGHGAALWMASLAASRASRTVLPDVKAEATTRATSGQPRGASSSSRGRGSSSSKTSPACSRRGLTKSLEPSGFGETFESWAMRLRADCSRRQKLAQAIDASGFSSSAWRTPAANNGERGGQEAEERIGHTLNLQDQVQSFPALWPTATDWKGSGPTLQRRDGKMRGDRLDYATEQLWYTPNVPNGGRTLSEDTSPTGMTTDGIKRQVGLENQANLWATPQARDHMPAHSPERVAEMKAQGHGMRNLNDEAAMWSTPRSTDSEKGGPNQQFGAGGTPLPAQAMQWATPTSFSSVESNRPGNNRSYNKNMELSAHISSLPDLTITTVGETHSRPRRSLNPLFVEWLMGWPPGWTLLAWTGFACSATALCLWKQRMRSALSSLALPQEAPAAQLSLFG